MSVEELIDWLQAQIDNGNVRDNDEVRIGLIQGHSDLSYNIEEIDIDANGVLHILTGNEQEYYSHDDGE